METVDVRFMVAGTVAMESYAGHVRTVQILDNGHGIITFEMGGPGSTKVVLVRDCVSIHRRIAQ